MSSLRSPAAPSPLDDDDLLSEILLRLPPQPSSLPCASVVCKPWRGLVTDAQFFRRFRLRHRRTPPLLGFFHRGSHGLSFFPTLEAPNRVPPGRFSLQLDNHFRLLGCRHGLALILVLKPPHLLLWDPVTGEQHHLANPPRLDLTKAAVSGAVLRAAAGDIQVPTLQGGFVGGRQQGRTNACLRLLVGDRGVGEVSLEILEFDLERQSLAVVKLPPGLDVLPLDVDIDSVLEHHDMCTLMRAEGGGLGFLFVPYYTAQAQLWKSNTDCDGVVSWGLTRAIELDKLLSLNLKEIRPIHVLGYAEYNNMLLLRTDFSIFTVQLESLQFKKFPRIGDWSFFHPFESVYTAGHKQQWVMGS